MKGKIISSYSIDYTKINQVSTLAKTIPGISTSNYFKHVKDIYFRADSLENSYKNLVGTVSDSRIKADDLISVFVSGGSSALEETLKNGKDGFSTISYGSGNNGRLNLSLVGASHYFQEYVNKYSELLELLKFILAEINTAIIIRHAST